MHTTPLFLRSSPEDFKISEGLSYQLQNTLDRMNGLTAKGLVHFLVVMSQRLKSINAKFPAGSDTAGLTPAVGIMAQHLISAARWNMTASSDLDDTVPSYPVRWQVYGSGPRLQWEWASVTIIAIVLTALLAGTIMKIQWRILPGPWLEAGGMMLLANQSKKMESVRGSCAGEPSQMANHGSYYIRYDGNGKIILTDDINAGVPLERGVEYTGEQCHAKLERQVDWASLWNWWRPSVISSSSNRLDRVTH